MAHGQPMTNTAIDQLKWKPQPARKHIKQKLKYHEWNTYNILILLISIYIYIYYWSINYQYLWHLWSQLLSALSIWGTVHWYTSAYLWRREIMVKHWKCFPLAGYHWYRISNGSIYCKDQMVPLIAKIKWFQLLQQDQLVPAIAIRSNGSIYCNKIKWFHLLQ